MTGQITLEVCVDSVASAIAAARGGAHRMELCASLIEAGITPSAGMIASVRQAVSIGLQVIIRPRASDFCYSDDEFQVMRRDVMMARQLGADGVVFGILDADGNVDTRRTAELAQFAAPMAVTFHRAFDLSRDLFASLRDLQSTGVHRVLTSGGRQTAAEGAETLERLVAAASGKIIVMAGGGIRDHNVASLIARTGVREIHAGLRSPVPSPMRYRNTEVSLSATKSSPTNNIDDEHFAVDERDVRSLLQAALDRELTRREPHP
jgi:copper homeostasis protein